MHDSRMTTNLGNRKLALLSEAEEGLRGGLKSARFEDVLYANDVSTEAKLLLAPEHSEAEKSSGKSRRSKRPEQNPI